MYIFCRRIIINKPAWFGAEGPLLLAVNHPNSFLDGIILTLLFQRDVFTLARGDAFRQPWYNRLLRWLRLRPVYRTSEGVENLEHNYTTFNECLRLFERKAVVVIFSEGRCINEWRLRPLRKGTARLATSAWLAGIDVPVLPVALNYNSFRNFGKNVFVQFGEPLNKEAILIHQADGKMFSAFNEQLHRQLSDLVFKISPHDAEQLRQQVTVPVARWKQVLLPLPALLGFLLHLPLYYPARAITLRYFDNDHFDSALVGMLALAYPLYWLLFIVIAVLSGSAWLTIGGLLLPLFAWACVQLKPQLSAVPRGLPARLQYPLPVGDKE